MKLPKRKHQIKKAIITLGVALLCALIMFLAWGRGTPYALKEMIIGGSKRQTSQDTQDRPRTRQCMLNKGVCKLALPKRSHAQEQDQNIEIEATPRDIYALESVVFKVRGATSRELEGRIYGLNMDMGEVSVHFRRLEDGSFEGKATMSSCTEEVMEYRMALFDEHGMLEKGVDFDAKRK